METGPSGPVFIALAYRCVTDPRYALMHLHRFAPGDAWTWSRALTLRIPWVLDNERIICGDAGDHV